MAANEAISASLEDYLEVIFGLVAEKGAARAKDIAERLKVTMASVTGALKSLAKKELVNYSPYDVVTLTSKGRAVAEDVVRRHEALRDFLIKVLALPEEEADEEACKMEHSISSSVLDRLIRFAEFVELCPRGGSKWIRGFGYQCVPAENYEKCEKCISLCLQDVRRKRARARRGKRKTIPLSELKPGERGRIVKVSGRGEVYRRIIEMGGSPGTLVKVERVAPFGDPMDVKLMGYHLLLRKEEARGIKVERV